MFLKKKKENIKTFIDGKETNTEEKPKPVITEEARAEIDNLIKGRIEDPIEEEKPKRKVYQEPIVINGLPMVLLLKIDELGNITIAKV